MTKFLALLAVALADAIKVGLRGVWRFVKQAFTGGADNLLIAAADRQPNWLQAAWRSTLNAVDSIGAGYGSMAPVWRLVTLVLVAGVFACLVALHLEFKRQRSHHEEAPASRPDKESERIAVDESDTGREPLATTFDSRSLDSPGPRGFLLPVGAVTATVAGLVSAFLIVAEPTADPIGPGVVAGVVTLVLSSLCGLTAVLIQGGYHHVAAHEGRIQVHSRRRSTTIPWRDLKAIQRWWLGWKVFVRDGSTVRISALGYRPRARRELDSWLTSIDPLPKRQA